MGCLELERLAKIHTAKTPKPFLNEGGEGGDDLGECGGNFKGQSLQQAPAQRAAVLDSMLRLILTLSGSRGYARSGRLLSRWATLEFTKFGYRFLAPMTRKFIDDWRNPQAERSIRRISQVFLVPSLQSRPHL